MFIPPKGSHVKVRNVKNSGVTLAAVPSSLAHTYH